MTRLQKAVIANGLTLLSTEITPPTGNGMGGSGTGEGAVLLVSRSIYTARIMAANNVAGIETPMHIFVTEGPNRKAAVIYRTPTSILALYDSPKLDAPAAEMDQVFAKIVSDAIDQ